MQPQQPQLLIGGVIGVLIAAILFYGFSAPQGPSKEEFGRMVDEHLLENPTIIVKAGEKYKHEAMAEQNEKVRQFVSENSDQFKRGLWTSLGNPDGGLTLVKFLDYSCIHCKHMAPIIDKMIEENPNLNVVIMELPIRGTDSLLAAKAAIAASMQNQFPAFHHALFEAKEPINEGFLLDLAKSLDMDTEQFLADMKRPEVAQEINRVRKLANNLQIRGTPYFIISQNFDSPEEIYLIPGAVTEQQMAQMLEAVQNN